MSSEIQLIVGLANPGKEYAETRHNAGGWFVNTIAESLNLSLRNESKYHGRYGLATLHGQSCHFLIPGTYMNLSGQAVRACMMYHKIPPESVLIAHDDIDLPPGTIRLKFDGGAGGHNGLQDIIQHLNTRAFHRLRIGVGHPGNSQDVADYVLARPSKANRQIINEAIIRAEAILPFVMQGKFQQAMQALHSAEI